MLPRERQGCRPRLPHRDKRAESEVDSQSLLLGGLDWSSIPEAPNCFFLIKLTMCRCYLLHIWSNPTLRVNPVLYYVMHTSGCGEFLLHQGTPKTTTNHPAGTNQRSMWNTLVVSSMGS